MIDVSCVERARSAFNSKKTRPLAWRTSQLEGLRRFLVERNTEINEALWTDLRKGAFEAAISEQGLVIDEIDFALNHLSSWMKPESVETPLIDQPGHSEIHHDPYGVVLIIGAWNYPVNLLLAPLVGALAGGNAAILKPSELAPRTSAVIAHWLPEYLDRQAVAVFEGGIPETDALLDCVFDYIFFTGSGPVGRIVMRKAAEHLTPVTLELGGKSPAIVMKDANLEIAARRTAWGKFMNAGQTCIAPDYVLVQAEAEEEFLAGLKRAVSDFYGEDAMTSLDYCRIVNARNFERLKKLLTGVEVVHGGRSDESVRYLEPTIVRVRPEDVSTVPIMQEEIFGPILPVIRVASAEEAIAFVNARPKPLALYLFAKNDGVREQVLGETSSGGALVNDVVMHMPSPHLPFGGVGASGMGNYHGKRSFSTFTHQKAVMVKAIWPDIPLRYAPYTDAKLKWIRRLT